MGYGDRNEQDTKEVKHEEEGRAKKEKTTSAKV